MSLINKMLRDLDARQAPSVDRASLPGTLHPLPPEASSAVGRILLGGLMLIAAGGWYLFTLRSDPGAAPPMAPSPVAAPPALPSPVQLPPVAVAPEPPKAEVPTDPAQEPRPALPVAEVPKPEVPEPQAPRPEIPKPQVPRPPALKAEPPVEARSQKASPVKPDSGSPPKLSLETKLTGSKEGGLPPSPSAVPPARAGSTVADAAPTTIDKRARNAPANEAVEAEYRRGMAALRRGATSEAFEALRAALKIESRHVSARQALLSIMVEQQQWNDAVALVEEGLALDPAQVGWAMALARLQLENGKVREAVETLGRHSPYADQNADYQAFHALVLQKQRRYAEAVQRYQAALALRPNESRWWYGMGISLESDQRPQEARAAFVKAKETGNLTPELAAAVEHRLR